MKAILEIKNILNKFSTNKLFENLPEATLGNIQNDTIRNKALAKRKKEYIFRPYEIMDSERYYSSIAIKLFKNSYIDFKNLSDISFPEKTLQLGEKANIYGKVINRVETLINDNKYIETDDSIKIQINWSHFTKGMTASEKRDLIKYRDYFLRIIFYKKQSDKLIAEEKDFLMINFTYRDDDGRLRNFEKSNSWKQNNLKIDNLKHTSIESVEIKLNKPVYQCLISFLNNKDKKNKKLGKGKSVRKSIRDLPYIISERLKFYKEIIIAQAEDDSLFKEAFFPNTEIEKIKSIINSLRYTDKMRIAFERIIDTYETGREKRKKKYIDFSTEIYDLIFPASKSYNHIRFAYLIIIFNFIILDMKATLPLFLGIEKNGKSFTKLVAELDRNID